jgi:O-antigen/teichoic acid export membrane protein
MMSVISGVSACPAQVRANRLRRMMASPYALTIACEGGVAISQLLVYKMSSHYWGALGFSEFAIVKRTISLLQPALALGLTVALPRQIAYSESSQGEAGARGYLCAALLIALLSVGAAALLLGLSSSLSARIFFGDEKYSYLMKAVVAMLAAITFHTIVYAYFRATRLHFANWFQLFGLGLLPPFVLFLGRPGLAAYFTRLSLITLLATCIVIVFAKPVCSLKKLGYYCSSLIVFGCRRLPGELILSGMFAAPAILATHRAGVLRGGFVAFGMSFVLMIGAAIVPLGIVLLPKASRMFATGRIADLERHIKILLWLCITLTGVVVFILEAASGPLVRAFLGQDSWEAVAASRILLLSCLPYAIFVCLRGALDACHDRGFNTQHVIASAFFFCLFVNGILAIDRAAYFGPLWSFVVAMWVLALLTVVRLHRIFVAATLAPQMMRVSGAGQSE